MIPAAHTRFARNRGQSSVEFALTIVFVMIVIFWTVELSMYVYTYSVLANAAKEGVRYAVVHGCGTNSGTCCGTCTPACADPAGANIVTQVTNFAQLSFHDVSAMTVNVNYLDGTAKSPNRVQVTVQYTYKPYFSFGFSPPVINAAAEGIVLN